MTLNDRHKAMVASYLRSVIGAMCAVVATGNYNIDDLAKAAIAAVLPPLLRWVNSNDPSFGRGS
jgi:hypothetical protein